MKISIIGPGLMPIPPKGWGAVESLIWDMANALKDLGQEVQIINTTDGNKVLLSIKEFDPDFVHINYDDFIVLYPHIKQPKAMTCPSHVLHILIRPHRVQISRLP